MKTKLKEENMNNLNSILMEGNLVRDPVLNQTPKGTNVCSFSVASNRYYKQNDETQQEVSFFDVEVWAKLAEVCSRELNKGRGVRVVGRLKQDRWTDDQGGNRSKVKIVGEHVEFKPVFSRKKQEDSDGEDEDKLIDDDGAPVEAKEEKEVQLVH
jgi:single-strand DNA-binding protein